MTLHADSTRRSWTRHLAMTFIAGTLLGCLSSILNAAELKEQTVTAWNEYVRTANLRMQQRLNPDNRFLWIDEAPDRIRQVQAGIILVSAMRAHNPERVPSGLIHHWIGAAFIPNATSERVFAVVRNYGGYKEFYRPAVIDSKPVSQSGTHDTFSMLLLNKAMVGRTALESDYESSYFQVDSTRWYSLARTTRVQEVDDYGQPGEHKLRPDKGHGYIWRLYSISRFEERDGGVYVELEAMALSRDIPVSFRWIVDPVVRRVSKDALMTSLRQTSHAVTSEAIESCVTSNSSLAKRPSPGTAVLAVRTVGSIPETQLLQPRLVWCNKDR